MPVCARLRIGAAGARIGLAPLRLALLGLATFVLATSACATPAAAQTPPPLSSASLADVIGRPVASVKLERLGIAVTDQRLIDLVETRAGAPLSMRDVRGTVLHLFNTGLFEDVTVAAEPAGSGVTLIYRLTPARTVARYDIRGDLGLSRSDVRRVLVERFGERPSVSRVQGATAAVQRLYADAGYLTATIAASIESITAETVALVITVQSGTRARIGRIDLSEGAPPDLLNRLDVAPGEPFDGPALQRRVTRVTQDLRNRGYYDATITATPHPRDNGAHVDLTIDAEPGPRVTVRVEGSAIPASRQDELVPVRSEGSIDEDLLEDSKRRIEQYLRSRGHARAEVAYARQPTATGLDLVFTVKEGPVFRVADVQVTGQHTIARPEIDGIFSLRPNDLFIESDVDAKTTALVERYRRQGFRAVKIEQTVADRDAAPAGREAPNTAWVDVRLAIAEGPQTRVGSVTFRGNTVVGEQTFRGALGLTPGGPFYEPQIAGDREAIQTQYLNRGFDRVQVDVATTTSADGTRADLTFTIREGAQLVVDRILIVGNRRTDVATIERSLTIRKGEPLGLSALFESQRRLSALGLFRRVRITDVGEPGETQRDVIVSVEEAPMTTIGYGAGVEAGNRYGTSQTSPNATERVDFAGRGFFEVSRRNLFGSNRSATLFTRASLRPRDNLETGDTSFGFNEYRVLATLRDPGVANTTLDMQISGYIERAIRSSFNFRRRGVQAQFQRRVDRQFTLLGSYAFSKTELFDERISEEDRPDIDRLFPQVRLSIFSGASRRDTRDDVLDPQRGTVLGLDTDVAVRALGSEVGFLKSFGELFWYRQMPKARGAVFATGVRVGLARGFPRDVPRELEGVPVTGPDGQPLIDTVFDLPASERFFAGGDTTVRGFARDALGDPDTLVNGFPRGGNAMIILNGELRVPVWRDFGSVFFVDAGNVFRRVSDVELTRLRTTAGVGVRYKSPIGPIRVDFGFKLDRGRFDTATNNESLTAVHISIGQAF